MTILRKIELFYKLVPLLIVFEVLTFKYDANIFRLQVPVHYATIYLGSNAAY